jgi:hypothetical protein
VVPYITGGVGVASFQGFAADDEAITYQVGAGSTLRISEALGLRFDARLLGLGRVFGVGATTNAQVTAGLLWRP